MADLIAKIGRFFADQEAQIQETYTQVAQAPARALPRPSPPVHKIPTQLNAHPPNVERGSLVAHPVPKPPRNDSVVRRLLQSPQCPLESINQILDGGQQQNKVRDVPPLGFSVTQPMARNSLPPEDPWSRQWNGGVVSWTSSSSPASTSSSRSSSVKDEGRSSQTSSDMNERPRKPRPPQQKSRKRLRKKKRGGSKYPGNQEDDQPDPKQVARENAAKVAAALVLAQERANRIQQDKLQSDREQELERQEAAVRLQEQMMKIEAVRARSFRQSSSSTMTTARSSSSYSESEGNNHETDSVWTADTNDMMELHKPPSEFMAELEAQMRDKISLEMRVKQSCMEKHKQRERVRLKLDKVTPQNALQSAKVARLAAMKASLEMELAAVLEDTARTRQQRRELELADEKERLRRQREAERALQVRLREEEWSSMMEDEKARSQVAAEARAKASKRVEAHSAKLRRMLQAYRYEPRSDLSSSAGTNNNEGNQSDNESDASISRPRTEDLSRESAQSSNMGFFLPPELADFEEDGLCGSSDSFQPLAIVTGSSGPESTKSLPFRWQVPTFPDQAQFTRVLLDILVSDDEDCMY